MRTRELRVVESEKPLGTVNLDDDGTLTFTGGAEGVFAGMLRRQGKALGPELLNDGWSNGYLYLADESTASRSQADITAKVEDSEPE